MRFRRSVQRGDAATIPEAGSIAFAGANRVHTRTLSPHGDRKTTIAFPLMKFRKEKKKFAGAPPMLFRTGIQHGRNTPMLPQARIVQERVLRMVDSNDFRLQSIHSRHRKSLRVITEGLLKPGKSFVMLARNSCVDDRVCGKVRGEISILRKA